MLPPEAEAPLAFRASGVASLRVAQSRALWAQLGCRTDTSLGLALLWSAAGRDRRLRAWCLKWFMTTNSVSPEAVRTLLCGSELAELVLLGVMRCCDDTAAASEPEISASGFQV